MKTLIFFVLFGFALCAGAEESSSDEIIYVVNGRHYIKDKNGDLKAYGMFIMGEESLGQACLFGSTFNQETAEYDNDKEDFYYTVANNTNSSVVVSMTTTDKEGLFCLTPFRTIESGECLKVYENDLLQSLASIKVNDEVLCDGWTDQSQKKCVMGRNYEINPHGLVKVGKGYDYSSANFNMTAVSALDRTDCKVE